MASVGKDGSAEKERDSVGHMAEEDPTGLADGWVGEKMERRIPGVSASAISRIVGLSPNRTQ